MIFDHFRVYLKLHKVPEVYFFKCMRLWVKQHWAAQSYLSFNLPLLIPFFNVIIYRQIVRRRNGYDTIWLDHFKRFEWHGGKIPPLKHFVRYNWGVAWLLDVFSTLIIEVFDSVNILPAEINFCSSRGFAARGVVEGAT